ncbi:hypothetical protein MBLNU13_g07966t1 [Cladosporium sp. NU13]
MTADRLKGAAATVLAPVPQSNLRRISQSEPQLSDCQEFRTNSNEEQFAEAASTALPEYRNRLLNLAFESLERPPLQGTLESSGPTYLPFTLLEPPSPGSTVENTEEEHEAAVELCLRSRNLSSAKRRKNTFTCDGIHERSDEHCSKRFRTIAGARRIPQASGPVIANAVGSEDRIDFPHINILQNFLAKPTSAKTCLEDSEAREVLPRFRPLNSTSGPVCSVVQSLTSSSIPFASVGKDVGKEETRVVTSDQDLQNKAVPGCADFRLSQVTKGKGALLGLHQIWCPVPGSWEDAVTCSRDMIKRTAQ